MSAQLVRGKSYESAQPTMKYQFAPGYKYFITYSQHPSAYFTFNDNIKEIILNSLIKKKGPIDIEVFSILDNHVHLLLDIINIKQSEAKKFLKDFATTSSHLINQHLNKKGANWEHYFGRGIFSAAAYYNIRSYVLGNPIRHGKVKSFDELYNYKYCNFKSFADEHGRDVAEDCVMRMLRIKSIKDEIAFLNSLADENAADTIICPVN